MGFRGGIFDIDGVLVDSPHDRAWRDALRDLMDGEWRDIRGRTSYSPERFTRAAEQRLDYPFIRPGLMLLELFDADISGRDFPRGKPDPMIFLTAAEELRAPPGGCFVAEDATTARLHSRRNTASTSEFTRCPASPSAGAPRSPRTGGLDHF